MRDDIAVLLMLAVCAYTDLTRRLIYNWVLLPCAVFGITYACIHYGTAGLVQSLTGALVGFLLLLLPFHLGGLGAGDVKMLVAIGALEGPGFVFRAFIASALIGGLWAAVCLLRRRRLGFTLRSLLLTGLGWLYGVKTAPYFPTSKDPEAKLPYGAVLALGTLLTYLSGWGK